MLLLIALWTLIFPFLYAFALSRPFGITKGLDRAILIFLNIVTSSGAVLSFIFLAYAIDGMIYSPAKEAVIFLPALLVKSPLDGLVWQFYLRDRKINGFLASLICTVVFMIPYCLYYFFG